MTTIEEEPQTATVADPLAAPLTDAPTRHPKLLAWVAEMAALTTPDRIEWIDGSAEQNIALHKAVMNKLAENGGHVADALKH